MNTTTANVNPSATIIAKIAGLFGKTTERGTTFVGLTYRSKSSNELARYVVAVGINYHNLVAKSLEQVEQIAVEPGTVEAQAKQELADSFRNTLTNGTNTAYTKAGLYEQVVEGINVSKADETFEVKGIVISRKVLEAGQHKVVKSKALTVAKDKIRKGLPVGKWLTLCLDMGHLESIRVGGTEVEVS